VTSSPARPSSLEPGRLVALVGFHVASKVGAREATEPAFSTKRGTTVAPEDQPELVRGPRPRKRSAGRFHVASKVGARQATERAFSTTRGTGERWRGVSIPPPRMPGSTRRAPSVR
jgi:hypothetical protein